MHGNFKRVHLQAEIAAITKRNQVVEREAEDMRAQLQKPAPVRSKSLKTVDDELAFWRREIALYLDPKMEELTSLRYRAWQHLAYLGWYRAMGFSAQKIANFESLLTEYQNRLVDINAAALPLKMEQTSPEIKALQEENKKQLEADELALLGEDGFKRLQDFKNGAEDRFVVNDVTGALLFTAQPLSADQNGKLLQVMSSSHGVLPSDDIEDQGMIDWDRVQAQAATFLSSAQTAELASTVAGVKQRELDKKYGAMIHAWTKESKSLPPWWCGGRKRLLIEP